MANTEKTVKPCLVKVGRIGKEVREYVLNGNRTVQAALEAAELQVSDAETVRVDGKLVEMSDAVKNGAIITVAGKVKNG